MNELLKLMTSALLLSNRGLTSMIKPISKSPLGKVAYLSPLIMLVVFILSVQSVPAASFSPLAPGSVLSPTSVNSCSDCSASSRYIVTGFHSSYTTTLNLSNHDAFNTRLSTVYKYSSSGTDFITVYHYFGVDIARNFSAGNYTFLAVNYKVVSLESTLDAPENDLSGANNAQRLSNIEEQFSESGTLSMIVSFLVGSFSAMAFVLAVKQ